MKTSGAAVEATELATQADKHDAPVHHVQLPPEHDEPLDARLFAVVSLILGLLSVLCVGGLFVQVRTYNNLVNDALAAKPVDPSAVLSYARALDAAIIKTSGLFLGYLLVFTGALYVLRIATSHYRLNIKSGRHSGNLQTSSPGLVMLTLGVLLLVVTILNKTSVEYGSTRKLPVGAAASAQSDDEEDSSGDAQAAESKPTLRSTTPPSEKRKDAK
jgi:hypothetical protein